ncbi:MAG: hypothetical protein ACC660_05280, partial [Acidimicrobiales bacterium]
MNAKPSAVPVSTLGVWVARIALGAVIGAGVFVATRTIVDPGSGEAASKALVAQVEAVVVEPIAIGDRDLDASPDVEPAEASNQLDRLSPVVSVISLDVGVSGGIGGSDSVSDADSTAGGSGSGSSGASLPAPALAETLGIEPASFEEISGIDALPELVRVDDFDPEMLPVVVGAARSEGEGTLATFIDPCAEDEDVPCPDPGEPGTVMGSTSAALIGARPFDIWYGQAYWPSDGRCRSGDRAGVVPFGIWTGNPVETMQLRLWPEDRPDEVQVIEVSTPPAERDEWLAVYAAATDPESIEGVLHCLELNGLEVETQYRFEIVATDVWGQRDAWPDTYGRFRVRPPGWGERPPTLLLPLTANEIVVSVPARPEHRVTVDAYARNDEIGVRTDPCTGGRGDFYDNRLRMSTMNVSDVGRMGSDYRWDRSFTTRQWGAMRLEEGRSYRLCVTWRVFGPSFDQGDEIVEGYDIVTPDRRDFEITITSLHTSERIEQNALRVQVDPVGRPFLVNTRGCGSW